MNALFRASRLSLLAILALATFALPIASAHPIPITFYGQCNPAYSVLSPTPCDCHTDSRTWLGGSIIDWNYLPGGAQFDPANVNNDLHAINSQGEIDIYCEWGHPPS